jgi:hypothetical protein
MTEMEITGLLVKLANYGITGIKVHYDGSGDSGAIEEIGYTTVPCKDANEVEDNTDFYGPDSNLNNIESGLHKLIEDYAYKILEDIEDWYNNEGGFGDLSIHIPSGNYFISNNIRVYDTEFYAHEGNLIEKATEK